MKRYSLRFRLLVAAVAVFLSVASGLAIGWYS